MKHERTQQEIEEMETVRDLEQDEQERKQKPLQQIADVIRTDQDSENVVREIFGLPRKQPVKATRTKLTVVRNTKAAAGLFRAMLKAQEIERQHLERNHERKSPK